MAKWHAKALVQKTISFLPNPEKVNYLFQKYVTKGVELNADHFGYKINHAADHARFYEKYSGQPLAGKQVLELGTGWYPIVPIALFLKGAERIVSLDIQSWMTQASQITAIETIVDFRRKGELDKILPEIIKERWQVLEVILQQRDTISKEEINQQIHLEPMIQDASQTNFADHTFDFICSNNTFEHVHRSVLFAILKEFKRIVKADGLMSHFIDLSDHFAHFDTSINVYNFLQFSTKTWQRIDNDIQPQNRLRWRDYEEMYATLVIPYVESDIRKGDMAKLRTVSLAKEFKEHYTEEEVAISHGYMISKMS
ncbi:MAG: class I SAM-dependent methyltransferase [Saprospiraceae bacterium]